MTRDEIIERMKEFAAARVVTAFEETKEYLPHNVSEVREALKEHSEEEVFAHWMRDAMATNPGTDQVLMMLGVALIAMAQQLDIEW